MFSQNPLILMMCRLVNKNFNKRQLFLVPGITGKANLCMNSLCLDSSNNRAFSLVLVF